MRKVPGDHIKNMPAASSKQPTRLEKVLMLFRGQMEEEELTLEEKKYLFALRTVYGMLLNCAPTPQIIGTLIKQHNYQQRVAYNILNDTQTVFGQIQNADKDFARLQAIEMAKYAWDIAKRRGDLGGMNKAIKNFVLATGIDRIDPDLPDFEKLAPSLNILQLPEGMEDSILAMLRQGAVNLNRPPIEAETIPYEDISDKPGGASAE
jgi:hypothetical protein